MSGDPWPDAHYIDPDRLTQTTPGKPVIGTARRYGAGKIPGAEVGIEIGGLRGVVTWQLGDDEPRYDQGISEWMDAFLTPQEMDRVDAWVRRALRRAP